MHAPFPVTTTNAPTRLCSNASLAGVNLTLRIMQARKSQQVREATTPVATPRESPLRRCSCVGTVGSSFSHVAISQKIRLSKDGKLSFGPAICPHPHLVFCGRTLPESLSFKVVGLTFTCKMFWNKHISNIAKSASRALT